MKAAKTKIITAVAVILIAVLLAATATVAWFALQSKADAFLVFSGDMDIGAQLYFGKDTNKDGILDVTYDGAGNLVTATSRADKLNAYYTLAPRSGSVHNEYTPGTSLTFKMVLTNDAANIKDADVSLSFAEMESYFYTYLDDFLGNADWSSATPTGAFSSTAQLTSDMNETLGAHATRLMFMLNNLEVRIYNADSATNGYAEGYGSLRSSSVAADVSGAVTALSAPNSETSTAVGEEDYHLWQFGDEKAFATFVLPVGCLAEIDFKLTCVQGETIVSGYAEYAHSYQNDTETAVAEYATTHSQTLSAGQISALAEGYIEAMMDKELSFLVDEFSGKQMKFSIDYITVTARQRG